MSTLGKRRLRGNPYNHLKGDCSQIGAGHFCCACSGRSRGNGLEAQEGRSRLDIINAMFIVGVVRQWNRLPRDMVE